MFTFYLVTADSSKFAPGGISYLFNIYS